MYSAAHPQEQPTQAQRTALADVMNFEVLINDKTKVWIFHDKSLPGRLAWVEFDPATGRLDLVPHDMRNGILYADVPATLHARVRAADLVYFYQSEGDKVIGFQKVPIHLRRDSGQQSIL